MPLPYYFPLVILVEIYHIVMIHTKQYFFISYIDFIPLTETLKFINLLKIMKCTFSDMKKIVAACPITNSKGPLPLVNLSTTFHGWCWNWLKFQTFRTLRIQISVGRPVINTEQHDQEPLTLQRKLKILLILVIAPKWLPALQHIIYAIIPSILPRPSIRFCEILALFLQYTLPEINPTLHATIRKWWASNFSIRIADPVNSLRARKFTEEKTCTCVR